MEFFTFTLSFFFSFLYYFFWSVKKRQSTDVQMRRRKVCKADVFALILNHPRRQVDKDYMSCTIVPMLFVALSDLVDFQCLFLYAFQMVDQTRLRHFTILSTIHAPVIWRTSQNDP
jgi:hypothetical protein